MIKHLQDSNNSGNNNKKENLAITQKLDQMTEKF